MKLDKHRTWWGVAYQENQVLVSESMFYTFSPEYKRFFDFEGMS